MAVCLSDPSTMMYLFILATVVLHSACCMMHGGPPHWRPGPPPRRFNEKAVKIMVNTLCSDASVGSSHDADACFGCFWRASLDMHDSESLDRYKECFSRHLESTKFNDCGALLEDSDEDGTNLTTVCNFEQCITGVFNQLQVKQCMEKAEEDTTDKVEVFIRTSKCVMCKSYCVGAKFAEPFEFGPKKISLSVTDDDTLVVSTMPYGFGSDRMCYSDPYGGVFETSRPRMRSVPDCDCEKPANEV
ncbi:uncharacterized protein [Anabrus simplex]|uniref:uncharacterized protein n=1 Tax=Anabrus simplex TaxID=316456 RepID=UPI0035A3218B